MTIFNEAPQSLSIPGAVAQQKGTPAEAQSDAQQALVSWVMSRVDRWRQVRDTEYLARWNEYYRLWRGVWSQSDKTRASERSRIIAPALAEAIDLTHAEITEAIFSRDRWFDVVDDLNDQDKKDMEANRDQLQEDMEDAKVPDSLIKAFQIGTLYGTGAVKISTEVKKIREIQQQQDGTVKPIDKDYACVEIWPLDPRELVPDPSADCIDDMLGIAHETFVPLHLVKAKQTSGHYFDEPVGTYNATQSQRPSSLGDFQVPAEDSCFVTEYHGKVPTKYLVMLEASNTEDLEAMDLADSMDEDDDLQEAIVTIANQNTLLRAKKNPFWMEDRSIVAYQHESVPGEFWGRGVAEKGYNPQKALDAEVRMRIDALALVASPMVAADQSRLPRGFDMRVYPGKDWPTIGNPSEVVMGFNLGNINPATFDQAGDLERMVKQGTGAMDPGTALSEGSRRDTATGTGIMASGFVKRAKRTMYNIENQFLRPLLQKIMWRYVQFAPERYKQDIKFNVKGSMGVMARELEAANMGAMYANTPPDSPAKLLILREMFDMSNAPKREALVAAIDQMMQPPDQETQQLQQMMKQLQLRQVEAEVNKLEAEGANQSAQAAEHAAKAQGTVLDASLKNGELQIKKEELFHDAVKTQIDASEASTYAKQTELQAHHQGEERALKIADLRLKLQKLDLDERKLAHAKTKKAA